MPAWKGRIRDPGQYIATCKMPSRLFKSGRYYITIASFIPWVKIIESVERVLVFDISEIGGAMKIQRRGIIAPQLEWNIRYFEGSVKF
jgi:hypothetical protein